MFIETDVAMTSLLKIWKCLQFTYAPTQKTTCYKSKSMRRLKVGKIILKLMLFRYVSTSKASQIQSSNFIHSWLISLKLQSFSNEVDSPAQEQHRKSMLCPKPRIMATEFITIQIQIFNKHFNVYDIPG